MPDIISQLKKIKADLSNIDWDNYQGIHMKRRKRAEKAQALAHGQETSGEPPSEAVAFLQEEAEVSLNSGGTEKKFKLGSK